MGGRPASRSNDEPIHGRWRLRCRSVTNLLANKQSCPAHEHRLDERKSKYGRWRSKEWKGRANAIGKDLVLRQCREAMKNSRDIHSSI